MGAFSGLTGYMTLGLGAKARSGLVRLGNTEALIVKDNQGFVIVTNGKRTKPATIDWPSPPDEVALVSPYIFSIFPPGTVPIPGNGGTSTSSGSLAAPSHPSSPPQLYLLPDKDQRRTHVRALRAVSQLRLGKFDAAIDSFLELDLNPAKVLALYPECVFGRLSVPANDWIPLFGGPASQSLTPKHNNVMSTVDNATKEKHLERRTRGGTTIVGALLSSSKDKDDDAASLSGKKMVKPIGQ
ncbi:hypothetical protein AZE42_11511 [Rhizopogon vesiculosus]|uniref:Uncharacterized protein n=1 Tax=Rhizopogon vesiculosus TaxID=180088 RepID=A0A1J8QHV1_9AGAM|nr:hypothetical protein AZE42_11511 [Rhizopogon vesiculosus]